MKNTYKNKDNNNVVTTVLKRTGYEKIEKLLSLVKEDRAKARIVIKNSRHFYTEIILFERDNKDINLIRRTIEIKMSANSKVYFKITHKENYVYKNGKFWYIDDLKKVRPLNPAHLSITPEIERFFVTNFPWMRFVIEDKQFLSLPFNYILNHKTYNKKDLLRKLWDMNYPTAKLYSEAEIHYKMLKPYKKYMVNIENTNQEIKSYMYKNLFKDTLKMAEILNVKVNCSWSLKRLKLEHDTMARKITEITLEAENRNLVIAEDFVKLKDEELVLIETTKDLAYEGLKQNHCVASYVNEIESGNCAIFKVLDYTLELRKGQYPYDFKINQLRGYLNVNAPDEILNFVINKIEEKYDKKIEFVRPL